MPDVLHRTDGSDAIPPVHERAYGRTTPIDVATGFDASAVYRTDAAETGAAPTGAQVAGRVSRMK